MKPEVESHHRSFVIEINLLLEIHMTNFMSCDIDNEASLYNYVVLNMYYFSCLQRTLTFSHWVVLLV
jgi:hypothetical protein